MNHFSIRINLFQVFIITFTIPSLRGQINTDIEKLQFEFFINGGGYANTNKSYWYNPDLTSTYSKFMLCTDLYQKIIGTRLMEGFYILDHGAADLPHFNVDHIKVYHNTDPKIIPIRKHVIHCPLNAIKYETLNYTNGAEFYITGSPNTECFYILQPRYDIRDPVPKLYVIAEGCFPFIDMNTNRHELELNYQDKLLSMGTNLQQWPELNDMDNGRRFVLCLDIHEKLIREQLYTLPYKTMFDNNLPVFDDVIRTLKFPTIDNSVSLDIRVLFCPMHKVEYERKTDKNPISPYYLAKSGNPDCVYKLATTKKLNIYNPEKDLVSDVHLVGEICGIFGPVIYNNDQLERELLDIQSDQNVYQWMEIHHMHYLERMRLCKNVLKKIYGKHIVQPTIYYHYKRQVDSFLEDMKSMLRLNHFSNYTVEMKPQRCPVNRIHDQNSFYVTESRRIGCVYMLSILAESRIKRENILIMDHLVCGIYPTKYLLQIKGKKQRSPLI